MIYDPVARARRHALRVVLSQVLAMLLMAGLFAVYGGSRAAWSAVVGGGIGVLATAYMAFSVLRHGLGTPAARVLWGFMTGWAIKVLLTLAMLVIAFRSPVLMPAPVLAAYVVSFIVYWYAAFRGSR